MAMSLWSFCWLGRGLISSHIMKGSFTSKEVFTCLTFVWEMREKCSLMPSRI